MIREPKLKPKQQGAATLLVVLVLAAIMAVISLATTNTGLIEQKLVGNDLRAREVQEASAAGLGYGIAWAKKNSLPLTTGNSLVCSSSGSLPQGCPTALTTVTGSSTGESYSYTLTYYQGPDGIQVTSAAQGINDNSIQAISEEWITQISYLTANGLSAPPIVVNGSLSGVTGNPTVDTGNPPGTAILEGSAANVVATSTGHLGGNPTLGAVTSTSFPATSTPAWSYVFNISLTVAIQMAIANGYQYSTGTLPATPASGTAPFYLWDSGSHINNNYGSATNPVVIIIPSGDCPKINGGPTIYGIIYYADQTGACGSNQGWGNATIYGTVIAEESITKLTANSDSIGNGNGNHGTGGGGTMFNYFFSDVTSIPGTWKDF